VNFTAKYTDFTKGRISLEMTIEANSPWDSYIDSASIDIINMITLSSTVIINYSNYGTFSLPPTAGVTVIQQNVTSGELCSYAGSSSIWTSAAGLGASVKSKHECFLGMIMQVTRLGTNVELKWCSYHIFLCIMLNIFKFRTQ